MIRTCSTCRYSRPPLNEDGFPLTEQEAKERNWLFCQIAPPVAVPGQIDCYPAVSPGERCGEWRGEGDDAEDDEDDTLDAIYLMTDAMVDNAAFQLRALSAITAQLNAITTHLGLPTTPPLHHTPDSDTEGSV